MPKSVLMLDKVSKYVFLAIMLLCFFLNACTKDWASRDAPEGVNPVTSQELTPSEISEAVEFDPEDVEESDPIEYEADAAVTKAIVESGAKDTYIHADCDPSTNKYKNYYVAGGDGYEMILRFSKPDTLVSLVNPNGWYQMAVNVDGGQTPTSSLIVQIGMPKPIYKARTVKWVATWQNGKTSNLYMKMIPNFGLAASYGSARYHVNYHRWLQDSFKFNMGMSMGIPETIPYNWIPKRLDVIHYNGNHFGVIADIPVQKNVKINGISLPHWVFKIKERNASCNWKATTKTFKYRAGLKVPSSNPLRDSATLFYRSY